MAFKPYPKTDPFADKPGSAVAVAPPTGPMPWEVQAPLPVAFTQVPVGEIADRVTRAMAHYGVELSLDQQIAVAKVIGYVWLDRQAKIAGWKIQRSTVLLQKKKKGKQEDENEDEWEDTGPPTRTLLRSPYAPDGYFVLTGPAGSGKTTILKVIVTVLQGLKFLVQLAAPTGKAASRIRQTFPDADVGTVHGRIYGGPQELGVCTTCHRASTHLAMSIRELKAKKLNRECPACRHRYTEQDVIPTRLEFVAADGMIQQGDVLIVDEASMIGAEMYADICAATTAGVVLYVGDPHQLPPVEDEEAAAKPHPNLKHPLAKLSRVHRQGAGSAVLDAAELALTGQGKKILDLGSRRGFDCYRRGWADVAAETCDAIVEGRDSITLTPTNAARQNVNTLVRERLVAMNYPSTEHPSVLIGDRLQCIANNHKVGVMNGEVFRVLTGEVLRDGRFLKITAEGIGDPKDPQCGTYYIIPEAIGLEHREYKYLLREETSLYKMACEDWELSGYVRFPVLADYLTHRKVIDVTRFLHVQYGYAITIHKCVHPDTLTETTEGLLPIRLISDTGEVAGPRGSKAYTGKFTRSEPGGRGLRIETEGGYSVTVTLDHGLDVWASSTGDYTRIEAQNIREGQWLRMPLGVTVEPTRQATLPGAPPGLDVRAKRFPLPTKMTEELAEFLGMFAADGTLFDRGFRLVKRHVDDVDRFEFLVCHLFPGVVVSRNPTSEGYACATISSTFLVGWLRAIGGLEPNAKDVPECVLRSPSWIHARFLRGLFADGWVHVKDEYLDHIALSQHAGNSGLIDKARVMLLRLGIVVGTVRSKHRDTANLAIYGSYAVLYLKKIGFNAAAKQQAGLTAKHRTGASRCRVPIAKAEAQRLYTTGEFTLYQKQNTAQTGYCSRDTATEVPALHHLLKFHHERVVAVTPVDLPTSMCVEVPDGHQFTQNGIVGWNSQGSQFNEVLFCWDSFVWARHFKAPEDFAKLVYTAITRATDRVVVYVIPKGS